MNHTYNFEDPYKLQNEVEEIVKKQKEEEEAYKKVEVELAKEIGAFFPKILANVMNKKKD